MVKSLSQSASKLTQPRRLTRAESITRPSTNWNVPISSATASGVRDVDPRYYELARAFGRGGFIKRISSITLPGAAPSILSGMRTGVGQAWMTLIAAELLGVPGMGQEMNSAAGVGAYDAVVVYMLAISLIYTLSDGLFALIENRALRWRP